MTRRFFRVIFLAGLLVLSGLSAGCGLFGDSKEVSALKLENANLQGRLDGAQRELENAEEDNQDLESELAAAKEAQSTKVPTASVTPSGVSQVITVSGSVLFRAGAASLTSAGKSKLDSVASDIKSRYPGRHISVEGHTDSSPLVKTKEKWNTNMWLSANRANAVANHLISRGIAENLVSVRGWGAGKLTGRGSAQDRRVEIVVLR